MAVVLQEAATHRGAARFEVGVTRGERLVSAEIFCREKGLDFDTTYRQVLTDDAFTDDEHTLSVRFVPGTNTVAHETTFHSARYGAVSLMPIEQVLEVLRMPDRTQAYQGLVEVIPPPLPPLTIVGNKPESDKS